MSRMKNANSCDFYNGSDSRVWISKEVVTCDSPTLTQYFLPINYNINAWAPSIPGVGYSPVPVRIADGRRLLTSGGQVLVIDASGFPVDPITKEQYVLSGIQVSEKVPTVPILGAPIQELLSPTSVPYTTITYQDLIPLYSFNDVSYKLDWDKISFQNTGMDEELYARTTRQIAFSTTGNKIKGDAALKVLYECVDDPHKRVFAQYIDPSGIAHEAYYHIMSEDASSKMKSPFEVKFDFSYAGGYKRVDLTPS
jgi:hypothetical protein